MSLSFKPSIMQSIWAEGSFPLSNRNHLGARTAQAKKNLLDNTP